VVLAQAVAKGCSRRAARWRIGRPNCTAALSAQRASAGLNKSFRRMFILLPTRKCGNTMCEQCVEIDKKIGRYRSLAARIMDQQTLDGIDRLVAELEAQKIELHREEAE
jgi:hypothetical protein